MECDRQGCLAEGDSLETRVLSDGCAVAVCANDLRHFREEGETPSVYFHAHTIFPFDTKESIAFERMGESLEAMLRRGEWQTVGEALISD